MFGMEYSIMQQQREEIYLLWNNWFLFFKTSATLPKTLKEFSLQPFHIEESLKIFTIIADKETFIGHLSLLH